MFRSSWRCDHLRDFKPSCNIGWLETTQQLSRKCYPKKIDSPHVVSPIVLRTPRRDRFYLVCSNRKFLAETMKGIYGKYDIVKSKLQRNLWAAKCPNYDILKLKLIYTRQVSGQDFVETNWIESLANGKILKNSLQWLWTIIYVAH